MNLYDLVNRPDRAVDIRAGEVVARQGHVAGASRRYVQLSAGAVLRLRNAHEITAFKVVSSDFGWSAIAAGKGAAKLRLSLVDTSGGASRAEVVADLPELRRDLPTPILFRWTAALALMDSFDFVIEATGNEAVQLLVGPAIDMRSYVLPYAVGLGVEVGPGLRPHVLPSQTTDVSYVEQQHPRDWLTMYNHQGEKPVMPPEDILARYRVGSAVELDTVEPGSLDFIFSNHVFEHLANPIQVMANWLGRLKPGGVILGVTPDPRFTFDCRQPPTTMSEVLAEEAAGGHDIPRAKYERWCLLTEPRHTPDGLIKRGYSIHVNYFTPEGFQAMLDALKARGLISRSFLTSSPNNKDFAFALWKPADAGEASADAWQRGSAVA